jgi:putative phosphoribosyl transferase
VERTAESNDNTRQVQVTGGAVQLNGSLSMPETAQGIVLCPYGGANRQQWYNEIVQPLHDAGLATLLFNLLTPEEEELDKQTGFFDSNVSIFSQRILGATNWFIDNFDTQPRTFKIGYFGIGASAGGALIAAAERPDAVQALVSCAGRPGLAEQYLPRISVPSLFLVAENDTSAVEMHRTALSQLKADNQLEIIPGTTSLFEDENMREKVTDLVRQWFARYLTATPAG